MGDDQNYLAGWLENISGPKVFNYTIYKRSLWRAPAKRLRYAEERNPPPYYLPSKQWVENISDKTANSKAHYAIDEKKRK